MTTFILLWDPFGTILGPFWDHFLTISELLWDHFRTILGPLWEHFGTNLGTLWNHYGTTLGPLWDHFGTTLGPLFDYFGSILGPFWDPSYFDLMLRKRGPKAPKRAQRAPQPSAGARRKGAERPELLVYIYRNIYMNIYILEVQGAPPPSF